MPQIHTATRRSDPVWAALKTHHVLRRATPFNSLYSVLGDKSLSSNSKSKSAVHCHCAAMPRLRFCAAGPPLWAGPPASLGVGGGRSWRGTCAEKPMGLRALRASAAVTSTLLTVRTFFQLAAGRLHTYAGAQRNRLLSVDVWQV